MPSERAAANARRRERAEACLKIALAMIETGKQRTVHVEVNFDYCCVEVKLHSGMEWSGEELHDLQEFMYEHGATMRIRYDHQDGPHIIIFPYEERTDASDL